MRKSSDPLMSPHSTDRGPEPSKSHGSTAQSSAEARLSFRDAAREVAHEASQAAKQLVALAAATVAACNFLALAPVLGLQWCGLWPDNVGERVREQLPPSALFTALLSLAVLLALVAAWRLARALAARPKGSKQLRASLRDESERLRSPLRDDSESLALDV